MSECVQYGRSVQHVTINNKKEKYKTITKTIQNGTEKKLISFSHATKHLYGYSMPHNSSVCYSYIWLYAQVSFYAIDAFQKKKKKIA